MIYDLWRLFFSSAATSHYSVYCIAVKCVKEGDGSVEWNMWVMAVVAAYTAYSFSPFISGPSFSLYLLLDQEYPLVLLIMAKLLQPHSIVYHHSVFELACWLLGC